ncbi:hypothetical protein [uncultured Psychroserpens sp.]|uniref:hypothetical protein n=1 Tax=uncultured Psychroserpens sp. TaxID=255436 RepID=UPI002604E45E|nr:hypothetical protein [uncultured Psychroserpens sp.]
MKTIIFTLAIAMASLSYAQNQDEGTKFQGHQNLIGGTWKSTSGAAWGDGTPFKLYIEFEASLNGNIIKSQTKGNISEKAYEFGLRSEGIVSYDNEEKKIKFYEFDVFGNLTTGEVKYQNNSMYYSYKYAASKTNLILTDCWEFIDKNTYNFTVGVYDNLNNKWEKKFLETQFKRSKDE